MSTTWTIVAIGAGVLALRLGGLVLPARILPPSWERGLKHVPLAMLSALVATSLTQSPGGDGVERWAAAMGAAVVAWRTGRMWACLAVGLGVSWLVGVVR